MGTSHRLDITKTRLFCEKNYTITCKKKKMALSDNFYCFVVHFMHCYGRRQVNGGSYKDATLLKEKPRLLQEHFEGNEDMRHESLMINFGNQNAILGVINACAGSSPSVQQLFNGKCTVMFFFFIQSTRNDVQPKFAHTLSVWKKTQWTLLSEKSIFVALFFHPFLLHRSPKRITK